MKRQILSIIALAGLFAALALLAFGCSYTDEGNTEIQPPTAPPPLVCESDPPDALHTSATPSHCTDNACIASFSVSNLGLARISWSFPGGDPPESGNASVQVSYARTSGGGDFPVSHPWSLVACTCSRLLDPEGESCRAISGTVTFNSLDG